MTEPKIINGDDVSKCKYYYKESCVAESFYDCSKISNCYRKQLKCKEQCLDKIKIIIEDLLNDLCNNCGWHNTDSCDPEDYVCGSLIKIKQIINEVENER